MFPFENAIIVLDVTGKELKNIIRIAESGAKGFFPVSGMTLKLTGLEHEFAGQDMNGDGKIQPWEFDRVHEIRTLEGTLIDDDKNYKLATTDFLVLGGDHMEFAMSKISESRKTASAGLVRTAIEEYIQAQGGIINSEQKPLLDPTRPRMVFEKPKALKTTKKGRRKRR